jgi:hypothetical protein
METMRHVIALGTCLGLLTLTVGCHTCNFTTGVCDCCNQPDMLVHGTPVPHLQPEPVKEMPKPADKVQGEKLPPPLDKGTEKDKAPDKDKE